MADQRITGIVIIVISSERIMKLNHCSTVRTDYLRLAVLLLTIGIKHTRSKSIQNLGIRLHQIPRTTERLHLE